MTIIYFMLSEAVNSKIKSGATIRVWEKVREGDKSRLSRFEGLVLARKHGNEIGASFTVRATIAGVGVEKVYPIHTPTIDKIEIISSPKKVHRAKLYYMRKLSRKETRQKMLAGSTEKESPSSEKTIEKPAA